MVVTKSHSVVSQVRARDLTSLMDLYECNYLRLRRLVPDPSALPEHSVSTLEVGLDLHLCVEDLARYTTTLNLTYLFDEAGEKVALPQLSVRIYHDAHLAEVMSCGQRRGKRAADYDRLEHDYPLVRKWEMNRFLYKWLGYLLRQRHSFAPGPIDQKELLHP